MLLLHMCPFMSGNMNDDLMLLQAYLGHLKEFRMSIILSQSGLLKGIEYLVIYLVLLLSFPCCAE